MSHRVTTMEELAALYDEPFGPSIVKEIDHVNASYRALIEAAPFFALATNGPEGLDCSPRGDAPGFVRVRDEKTLLVPDRRGNNRIDSLRNIVADPRVALLFLIPVSARRCASGPRGNFTTPSWRRASSSTARRRTVLVVTVERVFYQCTKAIVRSKLWDPAMRVDRASLPSTGAILAEITDGQMGGPEHDRGYPERVKATLY